jgi:hypothetical protein
MNSEPAYVVIAITDGDGDGASGHRIWSERFNTRAAAQIEDRRCLGPFTSVSYMRPCRVL